MSKWTKWCLALAVVLVSLEFVSLRSAEARSKWVTSGGYGFGAFPGAVPRSSPLPFSNFPFQTGAAVNMQQNPVFFMGPYLRQGRGLYTPNPFYHYDIPYGGYYWRPY